MDSEEKTKIRRQHRQIKILRIKKSLSRNIDLL